MRFHWGLAVGHLYTHGEELIPREHEIHIAGQEAVLRQVSEFHYQQDGDDRASLDEPEASYQPWHMDIIEDASGSDEDEDEDCQDEDENEDEGEDDDDEEDDGADDEEDDGGDKKRKKKRVSLCNTSNTRASTYAVIAQASHRRSCFHRR